MAIPARPQTCFDDDEVSDAYRSAFGAHLFNMYTVHRGGSSLLFSGRLRVVRAMLRAMLDCEAELTDRAAPAAEGED